MAVFGVVEMARHQPTDTAESLGEVLARLGQQVDEAETRRGKETAAPASPRSSLRKPPRGDAQPDFFVPVLYDVAAKDSRSIMDVAVFRLSKRDKRAGEIIRHEMADGYVEVMAGPVGMASVWDYDIVLMAISLLTEATNRYKRGIAEKPGRAFRPHISDILKFCRRSDGGRQYEELEAALDRLKNTTVKVVRTKRGRNGRMMREAQAEGLISDYKTVSYADNGRLARVEIELPRWIYNEIVETDRPEVLTVHPSYFLMDHGIGRFLYRLARQAAGKGEAVWAFRTLYERSGSTGTLKKFTENLRRLIGLNDLPEYELEERAGQDGSLLAMKFSAVPVPNRRRETVSPPPIQRENDSDAT